MTKKQLENFMYQDYIIGLVGWIPRFSVKSLDELKDDDGRYDLELIQELQDEVAETINELLDEINDELLFYEFDVEYTKDKIGMQLIVDTQLFPSIEDDYADEAGDDDLTLRDVELAKIQGEYLTKILAETDFRKIK